MLQALATQRVKALTDVMSLATQLDTTVNLLIQLDPEKDKERSSELVARATAQMKPLIDAANLLFFLGKYSELVFSFTQLQRSRTLQWAEDNREEVATVDRDIRKLKRQMQNLFRNGPDRGLSWSVRLVFLLRRFAAWQARSS